VSVATWIDLAALPWRDTITARIDPRYEHAYSKPDLCGTEEHWGAALE